MFYIPNDWIKNKVNESKVHDILSKHLYTDLKRTDEPDGFKLAIQELSAIGEEIIVEKLKDGTLRTD